MCVILSTPFKYKTCTFEDQAAHIFYSQRAITQQLPNMSQGVIDKLDCKSPKNSTLAMGDRVCNNTIEWNDVSFESTSRGGGGGGAPSVSVCVSTTIPLSTKMHSLWSMTLKRGPGSLAVRILRVVLRGSTFLTIGASAILASVDAFLNFL